MPTSIRQRFRQGTAAERALVAPGLLNVGTTWFETDTGDSYVVSLTSLNVHQYSPVGGSEGVGGNTVQNITTVVTSPFTVESDTQTLVIAAAQGAVKTFVIPSADSKPSGYEFVAINNDGTDNHILDAATGNINGAATLGINNGTSRTLRASPTTNNWILVT